MKNYCYCLFSLLLAALPQHTSAQTPQWHYLGDTIFSEPWADGVTLAFDAGTPYVAYGINSIDSHSPVVKRFDGATWLTLDTAGLEHGHQPHLSISPGGALQLAYFNIETLRFIYKRLENNLWENIAESPQVAGLFDFSSASYAFDAQTLFVAFSDPNLQSIVVWKYDGNEWSVVGQPGISLGEGLSVKLKISNGIPWVSYLEQSTSTPSCIIKKFDGTDWQTIGGQAFIGTFEGFHAPRFDFAVENGVPFIAYADWTTGYRLSVLKFDGNDWVYVGQSMFTAPAHSYYMKMAVDAISQNPYVVYYDAPQDTVGGGLSVQRFDGNAWVYVGNQYFAHHVGELHLTINNGTPYLGYQQGADYAGASVQVFSPLTPVSEPPSTSFSAEIQPNPIVNGILKIQVLSLNDADVVAQVFDMDGRLQLEKRIYISVGATERQMSVGKLAQGQYVLYIKSKEGRALCTRQFVVVR